MQCTLSNVWPVDPETGEDIEDLGDGYTVVMYVPLSRRSDVDRNDTTRRELTGIIEAAIAAVEE
tara:strand:+ start:250 stop:441 length:192 start_codon:yes stop_codon:yes gene_type:complete